MASQPLQTFDLVVIGAGPAGYTAAIRAQQLGLQTACIEQEPRLGGTCLRIGCIPSKALLESSERFEQARSHLGGHGILVDNVALNLEAMHKRKNDVVKTLTQGIGGLFKKNKVTHLTGHGSFLGRSEQGWRLKVEPTAENAGQVPPCEIVAKHVLVCSGSKESPLKGVDVDRKTIVTSTEALDFATVPKHLVVIGAGAIGLELGSVWRRLGAHVTVLEYAPRILPSMDAELAQASGRIFAKQGLDIKLNTKVLSATVNENKHAVVRFENASGEQEIICDKVLLAVGRQPNTDRLNLEKVGLKTDNRGRLAVNARFETEAKDIFATGDVVLGPMLAHKAEEEAVAAVEMLVTGFGHVNYDTVSYIVYTEPEVASVGRTEEQLKEANVPYKKGNVPFLANGRAHALASTQGFAKILAHAETDRILGAHIVGRGAGDLIVEVATAMNFASSSEDLARTCHPHPTMSEVVREACLAVHDRTLNF